ncbi:MAG: H-NS histone family protein [Pseudomonadota bacterium]
MAELKLDDMSLDELKELRKEVTSAIDSYELRKRNEALAAVEATARSMGYSITQLLGEAAGGKQISVPKFRHPEDDTLTWSGRGRQPAWLKEALSDGHSLEDLLIKS